MVGLPYGALCGGTLTGKYFDKTKPEYAAKDAAERPLDQCRHRIMVRGGAIYWNLGFPYYTQ